MNNYSLSKVFFLLFTVVVHLSAARVKQVCRRPVAAYQLPAVNVAPRLQEQGINKPKRQRSKRSVIQGKNDVTVLRKKERECLEVFREKCVTLLSKGRDLDDYTNTLFLKSLDMLEEADTKHTAHDIQSLVESIQKRANL